MRSNVGHPALNSSFNKHNFAGEKWFCNNCEWTVSFNIVLAFKWLFYYFRSMPTECTKCLNLKLQSIGQGVRSLGNYPSSF